MIVNTADYNSFVIDYINDCEDKTKRGVPRMTIKSFIKSKGFKSVKPKGLYKVYLSDSDYTWFILRYS